MTWPCPACRIDPHGIATVAAALPSCQALRALILNGVSCAPVRAQPSTCPLTPADCPGNDIGHHGSIALGESLPHASLTVLRMSGAASACLSLPSTRRVSPHTRSAVRPSRWPDCCIGDYGMGFLAEGLARSCVRALDLSCNSLKNGGAWCLGRAYEAVGNTSVTSLNISGECCCPEPATQRL